MIPTMPTYTNSPASSNQDHLLHSPQQHQQQFYQQPQFPQQQQFQHRTLQQQKQNQHNQSVAFHFHLLQLVENLADAIENRTRDRHSDALVSELNNPFEKCQQLLNSIAGSISSRAMTVEGQKRKLEKSEQLLNLRRESIGKYKNSDEELIKSEP